MTRANIELAPEQLSAAAVVVAGRALDAADGAELLAMLGLIGPSERPEHDQQCPSRQALQTLRLRRSADQPGPVSGVPDPVGTDA